MVYVRQNINNKGIGFLGLLFIVLLVLKLTGLASLSWWWVTAPLWFIPGIFLAFVLVGITCWVILRGYEAYGERKRRRAHGLGS